MKTYFNIKSYLLIILSMLFALIYSVYDFIGFRNKAIIFKSLGSIFFIFLSLYIYNLHKNKNSKNTYTKLIILGLFLGMLGDIFIELPTEWSLIATASSFTIGHILYSIAFGLIKKINLKQLIIFAIFSCLSISYIIFMPYIQPKNMFTLVIIYCIIISYMASASLILWDKNSSFPKKLCTFGAVLFLISDFLLTHELFISNMDFRFIVFLNTITYYPGQIFIALSLADPFTKNNKI